MILVPPKVSRCKFARSYHGFVAAESIHVHISKESDWTYPSLLGFAAGIILLLLLCHTEPARLDPRWGPVHLVCTPWALIKKID